MSSVPVFSLSLNDWAINASKSASPTTHLTQSFWLEPLDICVGYHLRVEGVPVGTAVYINDQFIGTIENTGPFNANVTNFVWLEKNVITFEIGHIVQDSELPLKGVRLEAIPCE